MTSAKFRDISLGIAALVVALAIIILFPNSYRLVRDLRGISADSRPELKTILHEVKIGAREVRVSAKQFSEDINSREAQRARLATQRAGESFAALAESMRAEWIPRGSLVLENGERTIGSANELISRFDRRLNADDGLVVQLSQTVASLRLPVETIVPKLVELIESGKLAADDVRLVLAGDDMKRAVAEISRASAGLANTTHEAARATKNLADTAERMPAVAEQLEKWSRTSVKYQKALILARLISLLGGIFVQ